MNPDESNQPLSVVVVNAGVSDPSSTRLLADRIAQQTIETLRQHDLAATVRSIDLGPGPSTSPGDSSAACRALTCRPRSRTSPGPTPSSPPPPSTRRE